MNLKIQFLLFNLLSIFIISCSQEDNEDTLSCATSISNSSDTLFIGSDKIYFNFFASDHANPNLMASIELVSIPSSSLPGVTVDLLQCKNGSQCLETTSLVSMVPNTGQAYIIQNTPLWLANTSTEAFIRLHVNNITYFLHDPHSNQ